jgi:hypothetical protein
MISAGICHHRRTRRPRAGRGVDDHGEIVLHDSPVDPHVTRWRSIPPDSSSMRWAGIVPTSTRAAGSDPAAVDRREFSGNEFVNLLFRERRLGVTVANCTGVPEMVDLAAMREAMRDLLSLHEGSVVGMATGCAHAPEERWRSCPQCCSGSTRQRPGPRTLRSSWIKLRGLFSPARSQAGAWALARKRT